MEVGHQYKMIPDKYKTLIYKQNLSTIYFYFLSSFIVVIFEMLSVGLIPVFALSITDHNEIIQNFLLLQWYFQQAWQ